MRVALFHSRAGLTAVVRLLPTRAPTLEQLGLPPALAEIAGLPNGLVIVTGPMGSGKTTTLWAMLEELNRAGFRHILSLQRPLEIVIREQRSLVTLREVGSDALSYAAALRAAFDGQDPDVVHIGEIPDLETLSLALALAETGHLVLTQMHTATAAETVERLVSVYPESQQAVARRQIASVLRAVVCQQLVAREDGRGRVPVNEIMLVIPEIARLIAAGEYEAVEAVIARHAGETGMQTMVQSVKDRVARGMITQRAAAEVRLGLGREPEF